MPLCDEKNYCFTRSNFGFIGFIGLYVINFLSKTTISLNDCNSTKVHTQPAITCSKLTIETLEQGVKYVQS